MDLAAVLSMRHPQVYSQSPLVARRVVHASNRASSDEQQVATDQGVTAEFSVALRSFLLYKSGVVLPRHSVPPRQQATGTTHAVADRFDITVRRMIVPLHEKLTASQVTRMRTSILIACLLFLPLLAGCSVANLVEIFSDGYTGGGYTRAEKVSHYKQQGQASQHYQPWDR